MLKLSGLLLLLLLLLVLALGGTALLAVWDIPPPSTRMEQTIPDDRFPR